MKWYIRVMRAAGTDGKGVYQQVSVIRVGPFTAKQLPTILKKIEYQAGGALRVYESRW